MLVERRHAKKDLVVGLLDIAIFLALMGQIGINNPPLIEDYFPPQERLHDAGPMLGLAQLPRYPFHIGVDYPSMKSSIMDVDDVMQDYAAIMQDVRSRLPVQNITANSSVSIFHRNVTAMMLRAAETHAGVNQDTSEVVEMTVDDNEFSIFNGIMPQDIELDLADERQEENNFNNGEDVRWRDFLNEQNSKNNENQHCEKSDKESECSTSEPDIYFNLDDIDTVTEASDGGRTRTTSIFSEESGIEIEAASPISLTHDHTYSIGSPTLAAANLDESFDLDFDLMFSGQEQPSTSSGANARVEYTEVDVDLQQMYLQDIDLGFSWQTNEVTKQVKDVDDVLVEKNKTASESVSYFVDGETGEQIPISQNNNNTQNQQNVSCPPANNQTNFFNLEEYFGVFTNAENQQQNVQTQNNRSMPVMVPDNSSAEENNEGLWRDMAIIPELNNIAMGTTGNPMMNNPNTLDNMPRIPNTPMPNGSNGTLLDQAHLEQQQNVYNTSNLNYTQCENFDTQPSNVFKNQTVVGYLHGNNTPTYQPAARLSPSFSASPLSNDEGIPMEGTSGGSSPMSNTDMNEQSYLLGQLNNYQVAMETGEPFGSGQRMMSPVSEPGQFFFDQPNNMNKMLDEIISINSNISPFENNVNGSYMNPTQPSFHPPPLDSNPGFMAFNDDSETHLKTRLDSGESYESDSGISMGHSPQRFGMMPPSTMDETLSFVPVSSVKDGLLNEQILNMDEIKAIQHNHTYNGTVGAKAKTKKKPMKADEPRESRDMRKARELNIPFTLSEIVMSPVEEYNEMLARTPLTPTQQTLVKDIRRRGKNKVAAQNCRKRKIETITHMEDDVDVLRSRKHQLVEEQKSLEETKNNMQMQYNMLYQQIFRSLRDESGRPYDPSRFSLEQVDSAVLLIPRVARDDGCHDNAGSLHSNGSSSSSSSSNDADDARIPKVDFFKVKTEKGE